MILAASTSGLVLAELGAIVLGLAVLARISGRFGLPAIPFYLIAGLLFGDGGLAPLALSEEFISIASEIGVVLLLLTLGLEYSPQDLFDGLRANRRAGVIDLVLNFTPGFATGLLLGWGFTPSFLLGGVTYISSSGVIAKVLTDLDRMGNRETPSILSILVIEDLVMAIYLPVVAVLLAPGDVTGSIVSIGVAIIVIAALLFAGLRYGHVISRLVAARSDEAFMLTILGTTLLVAGVAQELQVSSAVGAFLVGVSLSQQVSARAHAIVVPLRDLFAATFFLFFGLQVDPGSLAVFGAVAVALGLVTAATKFVTGRSAARTAGVGPAGQRRAGVTLIARGEFSIVIAGLGVAAGVEPELGTVAAAYVLLLAVVGPIAARFTGGSIASRTSSAA